MEHDVAAVKHLFLIGKGVEALRGLHHAREHRRLRHREVRGVAIKVGPRGGLHAVGMVTKGDQVEVIGEDFLLIQFLIHLGCHSHFAQLAGGGLLGRRGPFFIGLRGDEQEVVLDVLLVNGGSTLGDPAGGEVGPQGAEIALEIDAAVLVKALILNGDNGVFHRVRNLVAVYRVAALAIDIGHIFARGVLHRGDAGDIARC